MFVIVDRRSREVVPSSSGTTSYRRLNNALGAANAHVRKGRRVIVLPAGSVRRA